jgi:RNA polymerase sigma-70 factor, ECF subfamily
MSDDLVTRARAGDVDAFATLTAGLMRPLYATAMLILRDADQASDAVQDALVRVWVDLPSLRDVEKFDAWVRRILVHSCYAVARRRRRREVVEIQVQAPAASWSPDPQQSVALRDEIERGFRRLTPELRAVIVLRHYVGLSTLECADVLGIPEGTVKSRLNAAKTAMRASLAADERTPTLAEQVIP